MRAVRTGGRRGVIKKDHDGKRQDQWRGSVPVSEGRQAQQGQGVGVRVEGARRGVVFRKTPTQ